MSTVARVPGLDRARARRLGGPLGTAAGVAAVTLALHLRDPHEQGSWGLCPLKAITGWNCPLCGGLRAVNDLGHGQLAEAAHSNLLFVASLPLLVAIWALWVRRGWSGSGPRLRVPAGLVRSLGIGYLVLAVAFAVFRNTPWGSAWRAA